MGPVPEVEHSPAAPQDEERPGTPRGLVAHCEDDEFGMIPSCPMCREAYRDGDVSALRVPFGSGSRACD